MPSLKASNFHKFSLCVIVAVLSLLFDTARVCITDRDCNALSLIDSNILDNELTPFIFSEAVLDIPVAASDTIQNTFKVVDPPHGVCVGTLRLDWGASSFPVLKQNALFRNCDLIIGSDCIFVSAITKLLFQTVGAALAHTREARFVLCTSIQIIDYERILAEMLEFCVNEGLDRELVLLRVLYGVIPVM